MPRMMKKDDVIAALSILAGLAVVISVILGLLAMQAAMFDYVLDVAVARDVPWWLDLIASCITAPLLFVTFIVCLILTYCGAPTPFFG